MIRRLASTLAKKPVRPLFVANSERVTPSVCPRRACSRPASRASKPLITNSSDRTFQNPYNKDKSRADTYVLTDGSEPASEGPNSRVKYGSAFSERDIKHEMSGSCRRAKRAGFRRLDDRSLVPLALNKRAARPRIRACIRPHRCRRAFLAVVHSHQNRKRAHHLPCRRYGRET